MNQDAKVKWLEKVSGMPDTEPLSKRDAEKLIYDAATALAKPGMRALPKDVAEKFFEAGLDIASCCLSGGLVSSVKELTNTGQAAAARSTSFWAAKVWVYSSDEVRVAALGSVAEGVAGNAIARSTRILIPRRIICLRVRHNCRVASVMRHHAMG